MPTDIVVRRIDRVADTALDFDAEDKCVQKVSPAHRSVLGQRQQCRGHRSAGMDHRFEMGVIEVEHMRTDAIDQRRVHDVEPLGAAEHARLPGT